jgi:hypothetical protein
MTKRKAASTPHQLEKRQRRQTLRGVDLKNTQSVREQAEPYRIATAKFPIDALTPVWRIGSNRLVDAQHVQNLSRIFEQQGLQREAVENHLLIACSQAEVQRMWDHLGQTDRSTPTLGEAKLQSFRDWMLVNGCKAEIIAGQHRVEALKAFFQQKSRLHESLEEDPLWWVCDIYDKGMF